MASVNAHFKGLLRRSSKVQFVNSTSLFLLQVTNTFWRVLYTFEKRALSIRTLLLPFVSLYKKSLLFMTKCARKECLGKKQDSSAIELLYTSRIPEEYSTVNGQHCIS
jgi:hypothetical protein